MDCNWLLTNDSSASGNIIKAPDMTKPVNIPHSSSYVAPSNGWVTFKAGYDGGNYVCAGWTINGVSVSPHAHTTGSTTDNTTFPVKRGDVIRVSGDHRSGENYESVTARFFPSRP